METPWGRLHSGEESIERMLWPLPVKAPKALIMMTLLVYPQTQGTLLLSLFIFSSTKGLNHGEGKSSQNLWPLIYPSEKRHYHIIRLVTYFEVKVLFIIAKWKSLDKLEQCDLVIESLTKPISSYRCALWVTLLGYSVLLEVIIFMFI